MIVGRTGLSGSTKLARFGEELFQTVPENTTTSRAGPWFIPVRDEGDEVTSGGGDLKVILVLSTRGRQLEFKRGKLAVRDQRKQAGTDARAKWNPRYDRED